MAYLHHAWRTWKALAIVIMVLPSVIWTAVIDNFNVKGGLTADRGGCDELGADLPGLFEEAAMIIQSGFTSFQEYDTDLQVRKLAKAFFGIQMDATMTTFATTGDAEKLTKVKAGFESIHEVITGVIPAGRGKPWIFCDSTWGEKVNYPNTEDYQEINPATGKLSYKIRVYDAAGTFTPATKFPDPGDENKRHVTVWATLDNPSLKIDLQLSRSALYLSREMGGYLIGNTDVSVQHGVCSDTSGGVLGAYSVMILNYARGLTLCKIGFFQNKKDRLDVSNTDTTVFLRTLEPRSATIVHELYHLGTRGEKSIDLLPWRPSMRQNIVGPDGVLTPDPTWPGPEANFVEIPGSQADSVTDILLLALASTVPGSTLSVLDNPQTYAWAAIAAHLARNGGRMDYSTGQARPLDSSDTAIVINEPITGLPAGNN